MDVQARFYDGLTATASTVIGRLEGTPDAGTLAIIDLSTRRLLARWPVAQLFPVHARPGELRIGCEGQPNGARLYLTGADAQRANGLLPTLRRRRRGDTLRQWRLAGLSTAALAMVIGAYLYGVPLLAARLVWLVPTDLEANLGDTVAKQMETQLAEEAGFTICDPDPESLANRAIARFGKAAIEGSGSPFDITITMVKTDIPNAFALPGGQAFYFSALLDATETPDEFAGVLSHEIGHVVHRHGMEQLIASSGTGLLVGFVLGDMTGVSVAASLGSALIDSHFSREAETQADAYAAKVAQRLGFRASALADLLERVAGDDAYSEALALLSTHPLTAERRAALDALPRLDTDVAPFTDAEWRAIKAMCGPAKPGQGAAKDDNKASDKN